MRTFFILIAMVFSVGIASAQNTRANLNTPVYVTYDLDTITNAGTVTQSVVATALDYPFGYQVNIVADSLSGATAATLYIEHQAKGRTNWVPLSSTTIDGGLTYNPLTGSVYGGKIRVRAVGSGTQSTKLATDCMVYRVTK